MLNHIFMWGGFGLPKWVTCHIKRLLPISHFDDGLLACIIDYYPSRLSLYRLAFFFRQAKDNYRVLSPHYSTKFVHLLCHLWLDRNLCSHDSNYFLHWSNCPLSMLVQWLTMKYVLHPSLLSHLAYP